MNWRNIRVYNNSQSNPFDLYDSKYEKDGKAVKSTLEKWDDKVSFWEEKAKKIITLR